MTHVLTLDALKVAVWMAENGGRSVGVPAEVCDPDDLAAASQELVDADIADGSQGSLGEPHEVYLEVNAIRKVKRWRQKTRRGEIGLGILQVLESVGVGGSAEEFAERLTVTASDPRSPSVEECERVALRLDEWGMIKTLGSAQSRVLRSSIRLRGQQCLEQGLCPEDFDKVEGNHMGTNINNDFTGSKIGAVSQGDHNTLNTQQNVNTDMQAALDIVAGIRAKVAQAAPEQAELVDGIEEGVKTGKGKAFISALATGLAGALGGELGQWVFEQMQALLALPLFG